MRVQGYFIICCALLGVLGCSSGGGGGAAPADNPTISDKVTLSGAVDGTTVQLAERPDFWTRFALLVSPVRKAIAAGPTVDAVIAKSPDGSIVEGTLTGSGFSLSLTKGETYVVTLLEGTSIVGMLKADTATGLDSFPTTTTATNIDMGTISLSNGTAAGTIASAALVQALGQTIDTATAIGVMDDGMARLSTLDANGNGVLDFTENLKTDLIIQYVFHYNWASGNTYDNLSTGVTGTYGDTSLIIPAGYKYTIIEGPKDSIATDATWTTAVLHFPAPITTQTATVTEAGQTWINNEDGSFRTIDFLGGGPKIPTTPPAGDYIVTAGTATLLTFSNVKSQTIDTTLNNMFFPIAKLTVSGGKVTQVDWKWMKKTASGWVAATDAELQGVMDGSLMLICDQNCTATGRVEFPFDLTATGSITAPAQTGWDPARFDISWIDKAGYAYALGDH